MRVEQAIAGAEMQLVVFELGDESFGVDISGPGHQQNAGDN